jgi:excisionase family DNA binding protein
MVTFTLLQAAAFLKIHPEELRQRAKAGRIPGAKVGRAWVFLQDDLAAYLRSLYSRPRQALRVTLGKEVEPCHFAGEMESGGSTCELQMENEYAALLGLPKKP